MTDITIIVFSILISVFVAISLLQYSKIRSINKDIVTLTTENDSLKKSMSGIRSREVNLGQITEQLAPFLDKCPYGHKNMHFIGNPIDYISFEDDKIVFIEVKSGNSKLSERQKKIKQLVRERKIEWGEVRVNDSTTFIQ